MKSSFLKGVALGAAVAGLVLTATSAVAGTGVGGLLNLGEKNSVNAGTTLTGKVAGSQLQVTNASTKSGATGIGIRVAAGRPPLAVNSDAEVANLNADLLDGHGASAFLSAKGTAVNSAELGGNPPSAYLSASGTAANSDELGGIGPNGFVQGTGQVVSGTATVADNGSQSLFLDFTDWDIRGTCYSTGGRTDLVTHAAFAGTLNVVWWDAAGTSTAALSGADSSANIIPISTDSYVVVLQMYDGTNLTTITLTQVFNSTAGTCSFTGNDVTSS
jgi:hypothetical protein